MSYDTDLTGIVSEAYKTAKGKNGLIINCDNPSFKYPVKAYDGTFGQDLGIEKFKVGDKVSFQFEKTDFGNQFKHCRLADGSSPQVDDNADTSFNHGANVENRPDEERVISSEPIVSDTYDILETYLKAVDTAYNKSQKHPNLKNLNEENLRAVCIGAAIQHMRSNGR